MAVAGASGDVAETLRPPGRPVHRTVRDPNGSKAAPGEEEIRLVWAPTWPLRILHFPVRSFAQFKRRTEIAIFEGRFPDWGRFRRLREMYEEGRFEELYADLVLDDGDVEDGIRAGRLVRDERFARLLPQCPNPLDGGPAGSLRVEPSPDELQREHAELEFDAMQLLARTERWLVVQRDRTRERVDTLESQYKDAVRERDAARRKAERLGSNLDEKRERIEQLRAELRAERARPWARLRQAARRLRG